MHRLCRVVLAALASCGTPAGAQERHSVPAFAPMWADTLTLAPAHLEISAWWFGVVVRTLDVDPGIATVEGDTLVTNWVAAGFDYFDALADGTATLPFAWSVPASDDREMPAQGMRLGFVPDPASRGALTLSFVVFRHAPRRGYVFPVDYTEASRILGVLAEAAARVRRFREDSGRRDRRCEQTARIVSRGPEYPESFRQLGIGGEVWVLVDLDDAGRPAPGSTSILWASHAPFGDAVLRWERTARWTWPKQTKCTGPSLAPLVFRMETSFDQRNEGWIWVRRTP